VCITKKTLTTETQVCGYIDVSRISNILAINTCKGLCIYFILDLDSLFIHVHPVQCDTIVIK